MHIVVVSTTGRSAASQALVASIRDHHPGSRVTMLVTSARPLVRTSVADATVLARAADGGALRAADMALGWGDAVARLLAISANVGSIAGGEPVVVLPEWAFVAAPLDGLAVGDGEVGLVPRLSTGNGAVVAGGWIPEVMVVGRGAGAVLDAWAGSVESWCLDRPGLFDPWSEVLSAGGSVVALDEPGLRLSPRAVSHLTVGVAGGTVTVDGVPLLVASFPGFDPGRPWWYAEPGEQPPVSTSDHPALRALCQRYAAALDAQADDAAAVAASTDAVAGLAVGDAMRSDFRAACRAALATGAPGPANPFVAGEVRAFVDWWTGPGDAELTGTSRAADAVWRSRPDLATVFPAVAGAHQGVFRRWLWTHGLSEGEIGLVELPDPPAPVMGVERVEGPLPFGVNLVGYHGSEAGLGVAVRRVGRALDAAGVPWQAVSYERTASRQRQGATTVADGDYRFSLVLITPDQLPYFVNDGGSRWLDGHYVIGLWYWETDVLTPTQVASVGLVDEIWGATEYLRAIFARSTDKPVRLVPLPFEFAEPDRSTAVRERLGLDDRFTFLFSFDFLSVAERKNPRGLIEAYKEAFPEPGGQRLIMKSINGHLFAELREELADLAADRPDIEFRDRYLTGPDRLSLVALSDCYVSLHRSEGLGLTMAEAMAVGTTVIASRYSGNLDFTDDDSALLIDGEEIEIGPGHHYPPEGHWFAPDLAQAAAAMRRIAGDPALAERLAEAGRRSIGRFSAAHVGAVSGARLREVWDRL